MAVFLFLLLLAAITGVLGAVLKVVVVVVLGVVAFTMIAGWLTWRWARRSLEVTQREIGGTTTITVGRAQRSDADPDRLTPPRDDRY